MGERGPTSRPTTLKLLRGEKHRDRLNLNPPKPRAKLPTMPSEMSSGAKVVWRRILRDFGHTGVLTSIDADILRAYCDAVARYNHAARLLDESGPVVRGARRGDLIKNPLHQVVRDNAALMRAMARELGLSPAAREAFRGGNDHVADGLEAWLAEGEA
jgi:P27 family predicted phage terminase small subunit